MVLLGILNMLTEAKTKVSIPHRYGTPFLSMDWSDSQIGSQFLIGMVLHNVEETLMKVVFKSQFLIGMVLQKKHMELKSRQLVSIPHRYGTPTVNSRLSSLPVFILQ